MKSCSMIFTVIFIFLYTSPVLTRQPGEKLTVLWTSGDPEVAHKVCLMYTHAAKKHGWFPEVTLVVWGPSQRLLTGDKKVQQKVAQMQQDGVVVQACIACSESYGITQQLRDLDVAVKGMGKPLTAALKSSKAVVTF